MGRVHGDSHQIQTFHKVTMKLLLVITLICLLQQEVIASPFHEELLEVKLDKRSVDDKFEEHKATYGIKFGSAEDEAAAKKNFAENDEFIEKHNAEVAEGKHTFTVGHNEFSHWSQEERKNRNGHAAPENHTMANYIYHTNSKRSLPSSIDWRNHNGNNYVNTPASQGRCGSCWTFSATATLESRQAIKWGPKYLYHLSQQNLVDCCHAYSGWRSGCKGGWYSDAWDYVASKSGAWVNQINPTYSGPKSKVGQDFLSAYPYTTWAKDDGYAAYGACKFNTQVGGFTYATEKNSYGKYSAAIQVTPQDNNAMMDAVAQGPVSVAIDASGRYFQQYKTGIFQPSYCGTSLDHAVQIIGYGQTYQGYYYLLKNSWGTSWGDGGYFKFKNTWQNGYGTCGV